MFRAAVGAAVLPSVLRVSARAVAVPSGLRGAVRAAVVPSGLRACARGGGALGVARCCARGSALCGASAVRPGCVFCCGYCLVDARILLQSSLVATRITLRRQLTPKWLLQNYVGWQANIDDTSWPRYL
jgi:hypothetical protein